MSAPSSEKPGALCAARLRAQIEDIYADRDLERSTAIDELLAEFRRALNTGQVRAAECNGRWQTNLGVKKGLALLAKFGKLTADATGAIHLDTLPARRVCAADGVRVIDCSYFLRDGACVSRGCTILQQAVIRPARSWGD